MDIANLHTLIAEARRAGITLLPSQGQLRYRAKRTEINGDILERLRSEKVSILQVLEGPRFKEGARSMPHPILEFHYGLWEKLASGVLDVSFSNGTHWAAICRGTLRRDYLEQCVRDVVDLHDILGASVEKTHEQYSFVFRHTVKLIYEDLSAADGQDAAARAQQRAMDLIWRPFDPSREALFRPFALKVTDDSHVVGFVIHHCIADSHSVMTVAVDLWSAYGCRAHGRPAARAQKRISYLDYVAAYNDWLRSPAMKYRIHYWEKQLQNVGSCHLPHDPEPTPRQTGFEEAVEFHLDKETTAALRQLAARSSTTMFVVLLSLKALALSRSIDRGDIIILAMHHGRDDPQVGSMVGSTQNQLPLRVHVPPCGTFASLVQHTHEVWFSALEHQIPYGYAGVPGDFSELNVVDFGPASLHAAAGPDFVDLQPLHTKRPGKVSVHPRHLPATKMRAAVTDEARGEISYLSSNYKRSTIEAFRARFEQLATRIARDPNCSFDVRGALACSGFPLQPGAADTYDARSAERAL